MNDYADLKHAQISIPASSRLFIVSRGFLIAILSAASIMPTVNSALAYQPEPSSDSSSRAYTVDSMRTFTPQIAAASRSETERSDWGGIEELKIDVVESPVEKAKKVREEQEKKQREDDARQKAEETRRVASHRKTASGDSKSGDSEDDANNVSGLDYKTLADYPDDMPSDSKFVNGRWHSSDSRYSRPDYKSDGTLGSDIVATAMDYVGPVPYKWGGESMTYGTDCSGFVMLMYSLKTDIRLPHGSSSLMNVGSKIDSLQDAKPGDIIVREGHAALYVGNGMVLEQLHEGVRYNPISWAFSGGYQIRRVL